ncbi:lamin tail domain-containing protein [Saccharomonospora sp. NPDC046836]|uniref:lamin tail domain-containing protein n=1 Tax=Saccharomonospora sp. NPDC046836 TaxID=3156921 RepID=UPI0033F5DF3B
MAAIGPDVRISELASAGPGGSSDDFIEIANFGDEVADLDGWTIYRCGANGSRVYDPQVPTLREIELAPGETYVIAHQAATFEHADARYDVSLANAGFGAWLEDADRRLVDSVAVYAAPTDSECAMGSTPLPNNLDSGRAQTYQRVGVTGAPATPTPNSRPLTSSRHRGRRPRPTHAARSAAPTPPSAPPPVTPPARTPTSLLLVRNGFRSTSGPRASTQERPTRRRLPPV